jgi:pyruvate, water dikinase
MGKVRSPSESKGLPRQVLTALIGLRVKFCASGKLSLRRALLGLSFAFLGAACGPSTHAPEVKPAGNDGKCVLASDSIPDFSPSLGCLDDYQALASHPMSTIIPAASAVKTVIDRADGDRLYFPNTRKYDLHYVFVSTHLSGNGKPEVTSISNFGLTEYYTPERRFILGTLMHYTGAGIWAWELTPSDNASAELIALAYRKIVDSCFCGKDLYFHPTSLTMEAEARKLPASVKVLPAARLSEAYAYQPLNNATAIGKLVFATADRLRKGYSGLRDIVVLDSAPEGFPMVGGIITQEFQAPLSHLNVLSREHGIPNMGLRGALTDSALRALEGKWAKLTVDPSGYSVSEAAQAEADAWWDAHRPAAVAVPAMDTAAKDLRDVENILNIGNLGLGEALRLAIPAYGGTVGNFSVLSYMDTASVHYEPAFGVPVFYYWQHMRKNGLEDSVDSMLADSVFRADPEERVRRLKSLREAIQAAPIDSAFWILLNAKLETKFPGAGRFRFLSSANAEGLEGFTGAGLYGSRIGGRSDSPESVLSALLGVWAGLWSFSAFEERSIRNIDHKTIGMGLLVQEAGIGAEAEGAAITVNPFDPYGYQPGFYVNVKAGEVREPKPDLSGAMDQFVFFYTSPGQPIVMVTRADPSPTEATVLTNEQSNALGKALLEIYLFFQPIYGKIRTDWYGMGTEFRLAAKAGDPPGAKPIIIMERASPYRGWGRW